MTAVNRHLPLYRSAHHVVHFLRNHLKQSIAETMHTLRRIVQDPEFVHVMLVHFRENRVYVAARFRAYTLPPEYPSSGCSEWSRSPSHRSSEYDPLRWTHIHKGNGFGRRECGSWRCLRTFASFSPRAPANRTSPIVFCSCSGNRDPRLECDSNTIEWARFKQQIPSGSIWMIGYVSLNSLFLCGRIEKIRNWEETGKTRLNAVQSSIATSGAD